MDSFLEGSSPEKTAPLDKYISAKSSSQMHNTPRQSIPSKALLFNGHVELSVQESEIPESDFAARMIRPMIQHMEVSRKQ